MFRCPAAGLRTRATKRSAGTGTGNRAFDLLLERGSPLGGAVLRENRGQVRRAVAAVRGPVLARPPRRRSRRAARILRPVRGAATRSRREGDVGSNAFDPRVVRDRRARAARRGRGGQRARVARARHVPHPRHRPPHAVRRGRDDLLLPRPPIRKTRGTEAQPLLRTAARRRARGAKPSRFRRGGIGPRPRPEGDSSDSSDYSSDSSARRYARSGVARVSPSFELSSLEGRLRRDGSELGEDRGDGARGEADGGHRRGERAPPRVGARAARADSAAEVLGEEPRIERRRALHPAPRLDVAPHRRAPGEARGRPGGARAPRDGRRGRKQKRVDVRAFDGGLLRRSGVRLRLCSGLRLRLCSGLRLRPSSPEGFLLADGGERRIADPTRDRVGAPVRFLLRDGSVGPRDPSGRFPFRVRPVAVGTPDSRGNASASLRFGLPPARPKPGVVGGDARQPRHPPQRPRVARGARRRRRRRGGARARGARRRGGDRARAREGARRGAREVQGGADEGEGEGVGRRAAGAFLFQTHKRTKVSARTVRYDLTNVRPSVVREL